MITYFETREKLESYRAGLVDEGFEASYMPAEDGYPECVNFLKYVDGEEHCILTEFNSKGGEARYLLDGVLLAQVDNQPMLTAEEVRELFRGVRKREKGKA